MSGVADDTACVCRVHWQALTDNGAALSASLVGLPADAYLIRSYTWRPADRAVNFFDMTPPNSALSLSLTDALSALRLPATAATAAATASTPGPCAPSLFTTGAARSAFDSPPPTPPRVSSSFAPVAAFPSFSFIRPSSADYVMVTPPNGHVATTAAHNNTSNNVKKDKDNSSTNILTKVMPANGNNHLDVDTMDMNAVSPGRTSDDFLQSTNFESHLRASFRRAPTDRTGELVRLLHDISMVTHCISAYVAHDSAFSSTMVGVYKITDSQTCTRQQRLDPAIATRHMYKSLSHDGYACAILESHTDLPLTFPTQALHGGYVVCLCSLDVANYRSTMKVNGRVHTHVDSDSCDDVVECGTWFTVFRRKSSPSVPGRLEDVQQKANEQVAAGYVLYSSCTRLVYTLRGGVGGAFSFNLHPVTSQYFMNPTHALRMMEVTEEEEGENAEALEMWMDWSWSAAAEQGVKQDRQQQKEEFNRDSGAESVMRAAKEVARKRRARVCSSGCFAADFDAAMRSGGVIVAPSVHVLCVAAAAAAIVEEMGGKATNGHAVRILGTLAHLLLTITSFGTLARQRHGETDMIRQIWEWTMRESIRLPACWPGHVASSTKLSVSSQPRCKQRTYNCQQAPYRFVCASQ